MNALSYLDIIPEGEKVIFEEIKNLNPKDKILLFSLIEKSTKDGYVVYKKNTKELSFLEEKSFIFKNQIYKGKGTSYMVLQQAPHLLMKLRKFRAKYDI